MENQFDNLEIKNITLMDDVETREAQALYNEQLRIREHQIPLYFLIISMVGFVISTFALLITTNEETTRIKIIFIVMGIFGAFSIICYITTMMLYKKYNERLRPYRKLLEIAMLNDRIRHEERIRVRERRRIEKEGDRLYKEEDISNTARKMKIEPLEE